MIILEILRNIVWWFFMVIGIAVGVYTGLELYFGRRDGKK
jgi:hypothetical protein